MVFDLISSSSSTSLTNSSTNDRVFSTLDHHHHHHPMFHSSESKTNTSSTIEPPLSDERDLTQIENAQKQQQQQQQPGKWKMLSKRRQSCTNDLYAIAASRYHRFKPSLTVQPTPITTTTILATPPPSTSDEMHPASNDDFKFYPASINSRRSTTDCNDLLTLHHSRRLGNMETNNSNLLTIVDEESRDSMWPSTDDHHLLVPTSVPETPSLTRFYSDPSITPISPTSSSSASSFNLHSNSTDLSLSSQYSSSISFFNDLPDTNKILSSSSGYESNVPTSNSSLNSISDHLFLPSPDSIMMPPPATPPSLSTTKPKAKNKSTVMDSTHPKNDRNLVEQFIDLHLQKQNSFDQDAAYSPPSSFSSSSSSFHSQAALSTMNSPVCCRKCANHDDQQQLSSDTEDDSQSTTISTNLLPLQQQNKRPRSLPIAIQQPKGVNIDDTTEDEDDDDPEKTSSRDNSLTCHCPMVSSRKKRFRTCDLSNGAATAPLFSAVTSANGLFSDNTLISTAADKLHIDYKDIDDSNSSEHSPIKSTKNSLEHFIMSPTDKVKVQMKYPLTNNDRESDTQSNELKISQPEDIDFKRSKQKAIRVLYQNRLHLNSIQSPVTRQHNSVALPMRTATPGHGDSPLAKRTSNNPRLLRSVLSCSVFEADDEHEVVSSTPIGNPTGINGTRAKSHLETFNFLRGNFTESLLHGKILPCGILDGFTVKLGASGLFMPKQVVLPVTTFWFNVSEHQSASPYLGFVNLQCLPKRGYHTPTKGTITIALLNPNGTAVHLFLIIYDLSDMPPDHRTFIRQRIVLMPETTTGESQHDSRTSSKGNLRYLAHIRFVTSQTGKLYMHSDIRLIFARNKLDSDDRTATGKSQLVTLTDVPTPKYWSRK